MIRKLVIANLVTRKIRTMLTVAAIAISVSLVVAVTSGYASAEAAAQRYLAQYLGTTDAQITRAQDARGGVPESVVDELSRWPEIKRATGRLEMDNVLIDKDGQIVHGRGALIVGIRRPQDDRIENLVLTDGQFFNTADGDVAVVDQVAADKLKVHVGDTFTLPAPGQKLVLKVVGIIHKPDVLATALQTIYMPLETLQNFAAPDDPHQVSRILIDLQPGADMDAVEKKVNAYFALEHARDPNLPPLKFKSVKENRGEMDTDLEGIHILSYLGGTVSMLAATFIVFSALAMGVTERQRTLAMLRAVGTTRSQLAGLVVLEGILLALLGIIVGSLLGILWVFLLRLRFNDLLSGRLVVSWGGILFASGGSLAAALAASLLPAYSATRVSPLEAMSPAADSPPQRMPIGWMLIGIALVCLDPLLFAAPWDRLVTPLGSGNPIPVVRAIKLYGHFAIGLPGIMIGFFLMAPMFVWVIERLLGPIVAAMFGLQFSLLRQQLSSGVWRVAGTCAALMVGLATLVAMQIQGNTMLSGWKLPDKFPDIFIVSEKFDGLSPDEQAQLDHVQGIKAGEVMPIVIAAPGLPPTFWAIAGAAIMPNSTMFFGVPPDRAAKMMELDFRDDNGNPVSREENQRMSQRAMELLKTGRHIIVTNEFRELKGLKTGDVLKLRKADGTEVDYTIAGVVWSPGIDVIVSMFDMGRQFDERTAASVFGSIDDAKRDFGVSGAYLFAANLDGGFPKEHLMRNLKHALGDMGLKAGDVRAIKAAIQTGFARLLLLASTVAFAAMAVASLGVTNTIMASVRSRRWQFGILRSVGITRSDLLRIVIAEAALIGIVGIALGLSCGLVVAADARQLAVLILGYNPPLVIPWGIVTVGAAIVMGVSLAASIWPAIATAFTDPLSLLQAGRAAA